MRRRNTLKVNRWGYPIEDLGVSGSVSTGITFDTLMFPLWEAAIAAGATLDELSKLDDYPKKFLAKLIAWHIKHRLVRMHEQDAVTKAAKRNT